MPEKKKRKGKRGEREKWFYGKSDARMLSLLWESPAAFFFETVIASNFSECRENQRKQRRGGKRSEEMFAAAATTPFKWSAGSSWEYHAAATAVHYLTGCCSLWQKLSNELPPLSSTPSPLLCMEGGELRKRSCFLRLFLFFLFSFLLLPNDWIQLDRQIAFAQTAHLPASTPFGTISSTTVQNNKVLCFQELPLLPPALPLWAVGREYICLWPMRM